MSFSKQVKAALCELKTSRKCCRDAELSALIMYSGVLSGGMFRTEHEPIARKLADGLAGRLHQVADFRIYPSGQILDSRNVRYGVILPCLDPDEGLDFHALLQDFSCDSCSSSFLRGAFLVCGSLTDPEKDYLLQLTIHNSQFTMNQKLPNNLISKAETILTIKGIKYNTRIKNGNDVICIKESESIENFLAMIGASQASMEIMSLRIEREVRGRANRAVNMDSANISRQVTAAARQCESIRRLDLDSLPPDLRSVAEARLENPELSLLELGESMRPALSRSAVDRRLRKLVEMGEKYASI